mmetsp:Transcript_91496/g.261979  ORF Transcript_91496/g.261979 Transcript_91496/m.261979 type:complete len:241 (+) Transcript_91496:977-1699(+)
MDRGAHFRSAAGRPHRAHRGAAARREGGAGRGGRCRRGSSASGGAGRAGHRALRLRHPPWRGRGQRGEPHRRVCAADEGRPGSAGQAAGTPGRRPCPQPLLRHTAAARLRGPRQQGRTDPRCNIAGSGDARRRLSGLRGSHWLLVLAGRAPADDRVLAREGAGRHEGGDVCTVALIGFRPGRCWVRSQDGLGEGGEDSPRAAHQVHHHPHCCCAATAAHADGFRCQHCPDVPGEERYLLH